MVMARSVDCDDTFCRGQESPIKGRGSDFLAVEHASQLVKCRSACQKVALLADNLVIH